MRKFTNMPAEAVNEIVKNAGILLKGSTGFNPADSSYSRSDIIGATSGGINFTDTPEYTDFGDDIDNCPKNTMELKEITSREVKCSGTFVTVDNALARTLMGAADVGTPNTTRIIPRDVLEAADFGDIWFVTDYSAQDGGFVAIHLKNCLNTSGFQIQSSDGAKGTFSFEFTAHYSLTNIDDVPYEVYVNDGAAYEFTPVTITEFAYGTVYYIRTGAGTTESPYVYTEVADGAVYDSNNTYCIKTAAT